jgi:hypothetical protein
MLPYLVNGVACHGQTPFARVGGRGSCRAVFIRNGECRTHVQLVRESFLAPTLVGISSMKARCVSSTHRRILVGRMFPNLLSEHRRLPSPSGCFERR